MQDRRSRSKTSRGQAARYDRWIECEVLEDGILGGGVRWPG
jgi:hypothetical protein